MSDTEKDLEVQEMMRSPHTDGIDHINIFSRGQTNLGILLSNFTRSKFIHPKLGPFESMEGFYYYVSSGQIGEELRDLYGGKAKTIGKKYKKQHIDNFNDIMMEGLRCKCEQNPTIKATLINSRLPFKHYYHYGDITSNKPIVIHVPPGAKWWCEAWDKIRTELQTTRARSFTCGQ